MQLHDHQQQGEHDIYDAWDAGARCVMYRAPTGSGKSVLSAAIIHKHNGASCAIAHRKELVGQLSVALARESVYHRVIGPTKLLRFCAQEQLRELGRSWVNPHALCAVAGIDTLVKRSAELSSWLPQVTLYVGDEGHHYLRANKWGRGVSMFPNAKGLLVTATPGRADGKGLGSHAHGVADALVHGPEMRWLIDRGYLTDYRVFCPETYVDLSDVPVSEATGDYVQPKLVQAVKRSTIVGDVVDSYLRHARGLRTIVFATDVETAGGMARRYCEAGVRAEVVSGDTEDGLRSEIIRRFRCGELDVLVNVDLFGEGFDVPAVECVIMARHTQSVGLYMQMFGRCLRVLAGKAWGMVIDHVGNVVRHGLPDRPRSWSLDPREGTGRGRTVNDAPTLRICLQCTQPFKKFLLKCPNPHPFKPGEVCDHEVVPGGRQTPEQVEGAILELAPEVLAAMRGQISAADADPMLTAAGMPSYGRAQFVRQHGERREAQEALRASITWLAGWHRARGATDREIHMRFYDAFGVDVLSAQALGRPEAYALAERVNRHIGEACR